MLILIMKKRKTVSTSSQSICDVNTIDNKTGNFTESFDCLINYLKTYINIFPIIKRKKVKKKNIIKIYIVMLFLTKYMQNN